MSLANWLQFAALFGLLLITAAPLGLYLAKVYEDSGKGSGDRIFLPVERLIYRICRVDPSSEQR